MYKLDYLGDFLDITVWNERQVKEEVELSLFADYSIVYVCLMESTKNYFTW